MNYYNENDPKAAQWLRNLITAGLIPPGHVDDRSIAEVTGADLDGYTQCHFFAGIGGWSYALQLAGWPVDRPVWTGSCPCQPFSCSGKRKGEADERHLWPEMHRLIRERRPATCFGEQVASDDGCRWLAGVFADLEAMEYRVAGADLCAAGEAAPHIRQRLFWVAHANGHAHRADSRQSDAGADGRGYVGGSCKADGICEFCGYGFDIKLLGRYGCPNCEGDGVGLTIGTRLERLAGDGSHGHQPGRVGAVQGGPVAAAGAWSDYSLRPFRDGKVRRVEPGTFPVADGVPGRMVKLRGYGNAIVPQVAATFIIAATEADDAPVQGNRKGGVKR